MKKCSIACLCSGTNGSTEHWGDYLAISDNELTLSAMLMHQYSPVSVVRTNPCFFYFVFHLNFYVTLIPNQHMKQRHPHT